jgi:hypothetical protein
MPFLKIDSALSTCKSHLDSLDSTDPSRAEIEAHMVSALVVLIVSEYEELIERMFAERADRSGDKRLAQYVRATIAKGFRSPDLSKITKTLGQFGADYKESFSNVILDTEQHAAWDNIMKARHAVVHKSGTLNITLAELLLTYPRTKVVLAELKKTLQIA